MTTGSATATLEPPTQIIIDLEQLTRLPVDKAGPLSRYAAAIQTQRGDYNGRILSIRAEDLRTLAVIYDQPAGILAEELIAWGVLNPEARTAVG